MMSNNQNADLSDVIIRRTKLLEKLFCDCDVPIRIVGDTEKPMFVYKEMAFLSVHVKNFELHFHLTPDGKEEQATVKLRRNHGMNHEKFMDLLQHATHKALIKIRLYAYPFCVAGYNFLDREQGQGRYPVFARYGHKVYFNVKYVNDLVAELNADGYDVRAWVPSLDQKENDIEIILDSNSIA